MTTRSEQCGCTCICHTYDNGIRGEGQTWPGPCAGCCEPEDDCNCGRRLAELHYQPTRPTSPWVQRAQANDLPTFSTHQGAHAYLPKADR